VGCLRKKLKSLVLYLLLALILPVAYSQELEPRAYSNLPKGMNFLLTGYGNTRGSLLFDPSVPIQGAEAEADIGILAYVRSFSFADRTAKFGFVMPYVELFASGFLEGQYRERKISGLADPTLLFSISMSGAPALNLDEFRRYKQDMITGFTLKVTAPLGQYDSERLINLGTNRWTIKPEAGVSKVLGNWIVEGAAAISFYTENDEFFGGQSLKQDPIYSVQGHLIYNFKRGIWLAIDTTYYTGGVTTIGGIEKDNKLDNWRTGFTLAFPVNKLHSLKLAASTGVSTRTGTDFDAYLIAWQYRWGAGL